MKKKVVPKLRQEVKVKVSVVTSDDIKIYYTRKFQDFTARYIIKSFSRFVWAYGRAARIGRAILVCSIGCLPILEALPSLPLDIW